jgi:selenocysteine lyase/cysteine desulfurase
VIRSQIATTAEIRAHFPALERAHNGQPVAYFDGPGGTQVPRCVAEAMVDYLYHHNANTDWAYPTSIETDEALASARRAFADFLNASPDEIVFGANMTTVTFQDAVHYAPHSLPDVRAFDGDFLACSAYKFNGPHVGVLYGRKDLLQSIEFPKLRPAHDTSPERAETGTFNHEGIVGAAAAVDFFASHRDCRAR